MKNPLKVMKPKQRIVVMLVLVAGLGALTVAWTVFHGASPSNLAKSQVTVKPDRQTIGGDEASPEYKKLAQTYDAKRVNNAEHKGQTAVSSIGVLKQLELENNSPRSPSQGLRQAYTTVPERSAQANDKALNAKREFLVSLMKGWGGTREIKWTSVAKETNGTSSTGRASSGKGATGSRQGVVSSSNTQQNTVHAISAGAMLVAVSNLEINSDDGGPVSVTVATGPLRGANILGQFKLTKSDRLLIVFNQLSWRGYSTSIDAYAIDASYRTSLASHVDEHYLYRFGVTLGSAFLKGLQSYGQAVQNAGATTINAGTGTTTTVNNALSTSRLWEVAGGSMAGSVATELDKHKNIRPTVTAPRGTLMGVLFMKPVDAGWLPQLSKTGSWD